MRPGTVWIWEPVLCLERIFVGSAQGADIFLFGAKYYCVCDLRSARRAGFVWGDIYCVCGLGSLGSRGLYWSYMRSGTVSLWEPVLYLPKIIVIRPNLPFWIWHMLDSGSFDPALRWKLITYK